ncbi:hypothetical protein Vretifemale_19258 [Volvox reticuliferus]|nr:hypothetical protein Vretifemale_19258 [Volvox reticuliferus]
MRRFRDTDRNTLLSVGSEQNCCGPLSRVFRFQKLRALKSQNSYRATAHSSGLGLTSTPTVDDQIMASHELRKLCVFCGASTGSDPVYMASAKQLGEYFVRENIGLVYGGGTVGLMGEIARTVQGGLGDEGVMGVLPEALAPREVSGALIGKTHIVADMHTRKAGLTTNTTADEGPSCFVTVPGGGRLDPWLLDAVHRRCGRWPSIPPSGDDGAAR